MPSSDSGENQRRAAARGQGQGQHQHQQQHHHQGPAPEAPLACPRCDSANTKFCYYNNYNLSQPRHFCKACRRYWTHGGTLRDVPVGGGSRKNSKRSRSSSSAVACAASSSASSSSETTLFSPKPVLPDTPPMKPELASDDLNQNPSDGVSVSSGGGALGFTSLLNSQAPGFLALGGYGYGVGVGFDDVGLGYGARQGVWPFTEQLGGGDFGGTGGSSGGACNTWQLSGGSEGGLVDGVDCFAWPDLSISMPGNGLQ